jgi:hypothetical protein
LADVTVRRSGESTLLRGFLVLVGIVLVALCAAELLLRIFDGPTEQTTPGVAYRWDAELGWTPAPNTAGLHVSGNRTVSVKHNIGLRERELSEIAPDRILFLGDSFTYGFDAEVDERFSDLLQKQLPQFGTVNAGVSGYGTDQQFLMMQRIGAK